MVGLKKKTTDHIHKNLTQNGEPQRYNWDCRRRGRFPFLPWIILPDRVILVTWKWTLQCVYIHICTEMHFVQHLPEFGHSRYWFVTVPGMGSFCLGIFQRVSTLCCLFDCSLTSISRGFRPEWCISSMIYSRDTLFWLGTFDFLYKRWFWGNNEIAVNEIFRFDTQLIWVCKIHSDRHWGIKTEKKVRLGYVCLFFAVAMARRSPNCCDGGLGARHTLQLFNVCNIWSTTSCNPDRSARGTRCNFEPVPSQSHSK